MIEQYKPYIESLLRNEPWRAGQGDTTSLCAGSLSYDGTRHWLCTCGRIGTMPLVQHFALGGAAKAFFRRFARALQSPRLAA